MFRRLVPSMLVFLIITLVLITGGCKAISKEPRAETAKTMVKSDTNSPNIISEAIKLALEKSPKTISGNQLRRFPYPFDAMLAISSDIDLSTVEKFETYHRFLNTKQQTPYGQGLGLDIADSAWMYVGSDYSSKNR